MFINKGPRRNRVLLINCSWDWFGGVGTNFRLVRNLLDQKGHEVYTFLWTDLQGERQCERDYVYHPSRSRVDYVLSKLVLNPSAYAALKQFVDKVKPDWVYVHTFGLQDFATLRALEGQRVVHAVHTSEPVCATSLALCADVPEPCPCGVDFKCVRHKCIPLYKLPAHRYLFLQRRRLMNRVFAAHMPPSEWLCDLLRNHQFANVYHLPHFIVADKDVPPYPSGTPTVLYTGKLNYYKGVHYLARTIPNVIREVPMVRFRFLGDGQLREYLEQVCVEQGVAASVEFTGNVPRDEVLEAFGEASVCVLPSLSDNSPLVAYEAMANGRPIVASNRGGLPELVADGDCGYVVDPTNPMQIADRIIRLLQNPDQARQMGASGARFVREELNGEQYYRRLNDILDTVFPD